MRTNQIKRFLLFLLTIVVGITAWAADTTSPTVSNTEITASRVGSSSVDIFWHPAKDDVTPQNAITYYAYIAEGWGTGPYTREYVSPKYGTGYTFKNLKPNTKYRIFVTAADEAGNTLDYDLLKIETHSIDTQCPTVVDHNVFITDATETTISLKWAPAFDNQTPQDKLWYRITVSQMSWGYNIGPYSYDRHFFDKYIMVQGKNEVTLTDLEAGVKTYIWVEVLDENNNSELITPLGEHFNISLTDTDGQRPDFPNLNDQIARVTTDETSITLNWNPATDNITPKEKLRYQVQYMDCKAAGVDYSHFQKHGFDLTCEKCHTFFIKTPWMENINSYTISGLNPNSNYAVRLLVKDERGHWAPYGGPGCSLESDGGWGWPYAMDVKTKKIDTQPPYASNSTIKVIENTENSLRIKWEPASDDTTDPEEMTYEVYYQEITETNWIGLGSEYNKHNTFALITDLKPYTAYNIKVFAVDRKGKMFEYDPCTSITLPSTDTTPPTVSNPRVRVANRTHNSITLEWDAATDDKTPKDQLLYSIDYPDGHAQTIGKTSYTVTGLAPSTTYRFEVAVTDNNHNESKYTPITVTTDADPYVDNTPPTITDKNIKVSDLSHNSFTLSWERATDNNTPKDQILYKVYLTNVKNPQPDDFWLVYQNHGISSYTMVGLKSSTTFSYLVEASDLDGNLVLYNIGSVTTKADPTVVQKYDLYVKSKQVTSANAADVLGDGGSVSYDSKTRTLQLNNTHINSGNNDAVSTSESLNIRLIGDNVIDGYIHNAGYDETVFCGNGSLTVNAKGDYRALETNGNLTIEGGCTVQCYGANNNAISLNGNILTINASTLKAKGDRHESIVRVYDLKLIGCDIASGHRFEYGNFGFIDGMGDPAYNEIVISPNAKDTDKPTIPDFTINVYNVTDNSALLTWADARDNFTASKNLEYYVYLKQETDMDYEGYYESGKGMTTCQLQDLDPSTTYNALVEVYDEAMNNNFYREVTFTTDAVSFEEYELEVMNTTVTSLNCNDVLGDGGSVRYDNATKTLTLTKASLNGDDAINSLIPLTIILEENNEIFGSIYNDQATTLGGTGSLFVYGKKAGVFGDDLTVKDGTKVQFNGTEGTSGLEVSGRIIVINSTLSVTSKGKVPTIISCEGLVLTECGIITGQTYDSTTQKFYDENGVEATNEIRIDPSGTIHKVRMIFLSVEEADIKMGETLSISADVYPVIATDKSVTWSSSNNGIASVDEYGNVTGLAPGYTIITCSANDGSGVEASCVVTVSVPLVTSITLSQTDVTTTVGSAFALSAVITPREAAGCYVSWTTSNDKVAVIGSDGIVMAIGEGNATITCTAEDGSGVTASCNVTVKSGKVTEIVVSPTTATLKIGETISIAATVTPDDAIDKSVTWSSSDPDIATVDPFGTVTAIAPGITIITCIANDGSGTKGSCIITVAAIKATGIAIDPETASIKVGETMKLTATVTPDNATDKSVTWTSSDPTILTVSNDGEVECLANGTVTVTATTNDGSNLSASCTLNCTDGIISIINDADGNESVYSTDGIRLSKAKRGLNIIVTKDGKPLKIMKK